MEYPYDGLDVIGPISSKGGALLERVALWSKYGLVGGRVTVGAGVEVSYVQYATQCHRPLPVACEM